MEGRREKRKIAMKHRPHSILECATGRRKKTRSRRFQASLRTVLLLFTAVAIGFAFRANEARRFKESLKAVLDLGGTVYYAHEYPGNEWGSGKRRDNASLPRPGWARQILGDEYFIRPVALMFSHKQLSNADLQHVGNLRELVYVSFWAGPHKTISADGIAHMRRLKCLRHLQLSGHPVTDAGLKALGDLRRLESLSLRRSDITDAGLVHLKHLTRLKYLDLADTDVSDSGLHHFVDFGKLEYIVLTGTRVTTDGTASLAQALPRCQVKR